MRIWTHPGGMWTDAHHKVWQMQIASKVSNKHIKTATPTGVAVLILGGI